MDLRERLRGIFDGKARANPLDANPDAKHDPIHVRVRGLQKYYGTNHILKNINFDVYRGKTNMIIGPSGSGKTVMMRQLVRLESPDEGQILVNDVDIAPLQGLDLNAMRSSFGMVFQQSALFDSMSVFENVAFPLREHTKLTAKQITERVMDRLESLGIGHAHKKMPSELSGGMQRRVAVARALIHKTEIIIYDEPTTGLDPVTTCTVDELIQEAQEKFGVTSVVISHDMASVFRIADRITFLNFGEQVASGDPRDLLENLPEHLANYIKASGVSEDILRGRRR